MSSHESNQEQSVTAATSVLLDEDLVKRLEDTAYLCTRVSELAFEHRDSLFDIAKKIRGIETSDAAKDLMISAAWASAAMASAGVVSAQLGASMLPTMVAALLGGRFTFDMAKDILSIGRSEVLFEHPNTLIPRAERITASAQANPSTVTASTIQEWDRVDHSLLYMIAKLSTAGLEKEKAAKAALDGK